MADLVAGDRGSVLVVTVKDHETEAAIDLTGKSIKLRYKINGGTLATKTMTAQIPETLGKASYQFLSTDLTAGDFEGEVRLQDGLSDQLTSVQTFHRSVRAALV
jgi:hypothetical protein